MTIALGALLAYLLGAIPFGMLIARMKGIDIMSVGSGNIGATNVFRAVGKGWGLAVLVLDVAKGFLPTFLTLSMTGSREWALLVGTCAILGHCASPFLRFKGGKGAATALGFIIGLTPLASAFSFAVFLLCLLTTRIVSLSTLLASLTALGCVIAFGYSPFVIGAYTLINGFLFYRHRGNIARLLKGEERRIQFGKRPPETHAQG